MKYFIIAGEASGDLHGSNLINELNKKDTNASVRCWGGDKMKASGADLLKHYSEMAFMGYWEVLVNIGKIFRNLKICKKQIIDFKPDVVILIDYPGFNLKIASFLKEQGIKVYYYISPKVWAWKKYRIKTIKECVDRMYVIFPFETEFFASYDYDVKYFGNPLVEVVDKGLKESLSKSEFIKKNKLEEKPLIAFLAGSRVQEIKKILPVMVRLTKYYTEYHFVVAGLSSVDPDLYKGILKDSDVSLVLDQTYDLLVNSEVALVASGTATLETALINIPQVVCYRTSWLSFSIARLLVKIRFVSLVNLIMDKEVVKELLQSDFNEKRTVSELNILLPGGWKREIMLSNYKDLRKVLSGRGSTARIAEDIFHSLMLLNNVN